MQLDVVLGDRFEERPAALGELFLDPLPLGLGLLLDLLRRLARFQDAQDAPALARAWLRVR